jgi:glycosyltransferase involved in cell wall biosynthesis
MDANRVRVLRLYHSAVVDEYRERERHLRSRHGYDVHLICPPRWSEGGSIVTAPPEADFPVYVVPVHGRAHPNQFWYSPASVRRILRDVRPHIIDLHEEPYSFAVASVLRIARREAPAARICVYTAQNINKRFPVPVRGWERRSLAATAAAYPCSSEAGDVLRAKGFRGSVHVLPLGVSVPHEGRPPRDTGFRVGFVGRLESYKGAHLAVEAVAQLGSGLDHVTLELVGAGSEEANLRQMVTRTGLASRVTFAGPLSQDEVLKRIAEFDALVIPSISQPNWKEQFGRVAVQAMIAGTPVIAAASGSLPEVVGDAGALFPEGDVGALADALRALASDSTRQAELARRGKGRALAKFTWERVADGVHEMYSGLVAD